MTGVKSGRVVATLAMLLIGGAVCAQGSAPGTSFISANSNPGPGFTRVVLPPVTPEQSALAIQARILPSNINAGVPKITDPVRVKTSTISGNDARPLQQRISGDTAVSGPVSIPELARALRNNPDLIYEYVRNNIEYYPIWGIQKGGLGAVIDNQGTAFDQAELMVALLRVSGYTANVVQGRIQLSAAEIRDWLGIETSNHCAVRALMTQGAIPVDDASIVPYPNCPDQPVALISMKMNHVWVKAVIGGGTYYFDPSFKPHVLRPALDVAAIVGYNQSTYLTAAKSGATLTADYIQNPNRSNVRNNLTGYANTLSTYLRTNKPTAGLDDVLGGKTIIPHNGSALRQTSLPYQDTSVALTEWATDIPVNFRPALRIQYSGIDQTYTSDAIYGKRLSITYNASNQPLLKLNGTVLATGSAVTPGSVGIVTFTVTHPYGSALANQSFSQSVKAGGTFVIANGWGPTGRGSVAVHRDQLREARAAGLSDASEDVLGASLAVLSAAWIAQDRHATYIAGRLSKVNATSHHQIGIAGYNTAAYVDLPGNVVGVTSEVGDNAKANALFISSTMHGSIFESTAVQQTTGGSAVSTTKLIDIAVINGDKIFDASASNYNSVVQPQLTACASYNPIFSSVVNSGFRLILPSRCNQTEAGWTGVGYFGISNSNVSAAISGGLQGGFSTSPVSPPVTVSQTFTNSASASDNILYTGSFYGDPVDMVNGGYLYSHDDINVGLGGYPQSLSFQRSYSSGARTQDGPLGKGWTHNFSASATVGSDGFQGMGEDSALDAVGTIVEQMVSLDLLTDPNRPLDKVVTASLGHRWFGDQIINNTVTVTQGLNGELFVKLPDGSYNPAPGKSAKLIKNGDASYTYEGLHKDQLFFNTAGKLVNHVFQSGVEVHLSYSGNDLVQVQNSLGRTLNIGYAAGRISQVSDGSRTVRYAYDGAGNQTTYTDATNQNTTFQYDLPGRMTKFFYPSNPSIAFATNEYDSLGRVRKQINANGKVYDYYFAGSRTEEVGPGNTSRASYIDGDRNIIKSIDPLGRVTLNEYDGQSRLIRRTLPEGNVVESDYDDAPCLAQLRCTHNVKTVRQIPKAGSGLPTLISSFTYESSFNQVATSTDPRGQTTDTYYNSRGLPVQVVTPADGAGVRPSTIFTYALLTAPAGWPAFFMPNGGNAKTSASNTVETVTTYNTANFYVPQTTVVDSGSGKLNLTTTFTYDGVGNLTNVDGPRTDVTDTVAITYDAERRQTQVTDALGKLTFKAYDADGRLIRSSAQLGSQWLVACQSFTPSGKLLKAWGPALTTAATTCPSSAAPVAVADYVYDDLDRPQRVTQNLPASEGGNRVSETLYNLDNSVQSVKRGVGTALAQTYATYTYTLNGLVASVADAKGNLTRYEYDGHDRKAKTLYPSPSTPGVSSATDYEQYAYDNNANLTTLRKRSGVTINMGYDNLNRMFNRSYPASSADNVSYGYDLLGRRTAANYTDASHNISYVWDNAGRLTSTTSGAGATSKTLSYQYDAAGNRTRTTWPEATPFYVTATYDALNRPKDLLENGSSNLATYTYDDLSRRATINRGNGSSTGYAYNTQGNLSGLAHNVGSTAFNINYAYTRNQAQEITTHTWSNDAYQWMGSPTGSTPYSSNGLNQYTSVGNVSQSHDTNGNLTQTKNWAYTYDSNNRLKTAASSGLSNSVNASLSYDPEGRLSKTSIDTSGSNTTTQLLYDAVALVAEYDAAGTMQRRYVHGPGVDEPLVWYEGASTTNKNWLFQDHLGSVVTALKPTGSTPAANVNTYGPFGETTQAAVDNNRFGYTGQAQLKQLGLYYYKARMYSPDLGRFLQEDPIGTVDDLNLYAYVGGDPVNMRDPDGLIKVPEGVLNFIRTFTPGPFAREGVPLTGPGRPSAATRTEINANGAANGCHLCGASTPGTATGNWVPDHIPPSSVANGAPQTGYPSCINCSRAQGGITSAVSRGGQAGAVALEFLLDLLTPVLLTPTTLAPGTLYGSGTPYSDRDSFERANGFSPRSPPRK